MLLRPRISCFYCGSKSKYARNQRIRSFQCTVCEGTNYLDEQGNITDVPESAVRDARTQTPVAAVTNKSTDNPSASIFCNQCITNQTIVSNCLANYLPSEDDPKYGEFESRLYGYKRDLERRYPQVCPRCEAKVRDRLKKNTYAAQSSTFKTKLARQHGAGPPSPTLSITLLYYAELLWWASLVIQCGWHFLTIMGKVNAPYETAEVRGEITAAQWSKCIQQLPKSGSLDLQCSRPLSDAVKYAVGIGALLLWWNPRMKSPQWSSITNRATCYQFQGLLQAVRAGCWYFTSSDWARPHNDIGRAINGFACVFIPLAAFVTYRIPKAPPRYVAKKHNLDAPLVDPDAIDVANDFDITLSRPDTPQSSRFDLYSLRAANSRTAHERPTTSSTTSVDPSVEDDVARMEPSGDAMDWEPVRLSNNLRPRGANTVHQTHQPATQSASQGSTYSTSTSPFYGNLPPAPKSLEAKLRTAAQRQAPQFRPVSDVKQADWFRRMGLAQSAGSWTNKDYVHTVKKEGELPEFTPGKLKLDGLGSRRNDGTGLSEMFGSSFRIDDNEILQENVDIPPPSVESHSSSTFLFTTSAMFVCMVSIWWFAPAKWNEWTQLAQDSLKRAQGLAYGQ